MLTDNVGFAQNETDPTAIMLIETTKGRMSRIELAIGLLDHAATIIADARRAMLTHAEGDGRARLSAFEQAVKLEASHCLGPFNAGSIAKRLAETHHGSSMAKVSKALQKLKHHWGLVEFVHHKRHWRWIG